MPNVYGYIAECNNYEDILKTLEELYVKPKNEIFASHIIATHKQQFNETLSQFLIKLKILARDCNYKAVTAEQ